MITAADATPLLQQLIRNACVNYATPESGFEQRSVETLRDFLPSSGFDHVTIESLPSRSSLICKIEGSDPSAPSLMLMGHTDVVPVADPSRWDRDPFGGELVDGIIWGRGAVDMLDVTSTMAVAFAQLAEQGFRPKGTLTYLAVCDEEALGTHGAKFLTEQHREAVQSDVVLTEFGGIRMNFGGNVPVMPVMVGEKGTYWCTIRVAGTPGHASMPFRSDNALVTAARIVDRLARYSPQPVLHETWLAFADALPVPEELRVILREPSALEEMLNSPEADIGTVRMLHAATHTTFAPTILHAGIKTNVIPDAVDLQVDVRTLPGHEATQVREMIREAIGDELFAKIEITADSDSPANVTPSATSHRAWKVISEVTSRLVPGARTVPSLLVAATDARYFRKIGAACYGTGIKSDRMDFSEFRSMFHGDNERVDVESLQLQTEYWKTLAHELVG